MTTSPARERMITRNRQVNTMPAPDVRARAAAATAVADARRDLAVADAYAHERKVERMRDKTLAERVADAVDRQTGKVDPHAELQEQARAARKIANAYSAVTEALRELDEAIKDRDNAAGRIERRTADLEKARARLAVILKEQSA